MFELLKKEKRSTGLKEAVIGKEKKTTAQIIAEIHHSFFTEVENLREAANIHAPLDTGKQGLIDKYNRLMALGFVNSKEAIAGIREIVNQSSISTQNELKKELLDAINFFSHTYPMYKFITEESVSRICREYGLIYGEVRRYTGSVPDENLKHMEQFKIKEEHECYCYIHQRGSFATLGDAVYQTKTENIKQKQQDEEMYSFSYEQERGMKLEYFKCPLEIVAPITDFNMSGIKVENNKLQKDVIPVPDPIVLSPVVYKSKKYYLIVTAWGEEASDIDVVNQRMN